MHKWIAIFLCALAVAFVSVANPLLSDEIEKEIHKFSGEDLNVGIYTKDLATGEEFTLHSDRLFTPASVTKLFTSYVALRKLGPNYKITTEFLAKSGSIKSGVLDSNLYIKFQGDPTLTYEQLKESFAQLKLSKIKGDIVIDDEFLDKHTTSSGGFTWDDQPFCYAAPTGAIIIDKNCARAEMDPAKRVGKTSLLNIDRPHILAILNNVETVDGGVKQCPFKSKYLGDNKYDVYGCVVKSSETVKLNFALPDTRLMIVSYIKHILHSYGIEFTGKISFGPASGVKLYSHQSLPLSDWIEVILKDSNNISSAALFKHMGAKFSKDHIGSDENATALSRDVLSGDGLDLKQYRIIDGSGESKHNLVSPRTIGDLLVKAYHNSKMREQFLQALPKYGEEGTLKNRDKNAQYSGYIWAKTGTLDSVTALAGYYLPERGNKLVFVIMINNTTMTYKQKKEVENKILDIIFASDK